MNSEINNILVQISKRAEKLEKEYIIDSFVNVGNLLSALSVNEHTVLFGRRGTGKTHFLRYLAEQKNKLGDLAFYIDMRSIGSNGGIYNDHNESISSRATK